MSDPNIHSLRAAAAYWLLKKCSCALVATEQALGGRGRSDVLGCEASGRILEIEIKTSVQDFKHNVRKHSLLLRQNEGSEPSFFYFLVPPGIVEQVEPLSEAGQGIITAAATGWYAPGVPKLRIVRAAKENPAAEILTLEGMVLFAERQSRQYAVKLGHLALLHRKE